MPRQSLPSSAPPSVRLRVGECTVDMPLREILAPGARRPRRVTPKAIAVLAMLVEQAGRVVAREALLAQVWAGTLPTDDVLTQAITQLRKAFDDERGNPRYIETIAKYGYRLLAPVEVLAQVAPAVTTTGEYPALPGGNGPEEAPEGFVPVPRPPLPQAPVDVRGDWRGLAAAVGVALAVVGLMLAWSTRRPPVDPAPPPAHASSIAALPFRLITSLPGVESSPTVSPDGALVAYVAAPGGSRHTAVLVQTSEPGPARRLTGPNSGVDDRAPAWSPDGRDIAFLRVAPDRCRILVVPANGGTERPVGECDPRGAPSFDWTHDGRGLVFGSRGTPIPGPGLRVLDLAGGGWRLLDSDAGPGDIDFAPRFSPDGRWVVFVRNSPVGDLWRIPATGGRAQRLTRLHADIRGWDWTADGRAIVLSRWSGSESRLLRLDLASGLLQDLGIADAVQPAIAGRAAGMAFTQVRNLFGLHRFTVDGAGADAGTSGVVGRVERMFPSSGRDRLPALAPDGRQLVFTSDRSGQFALWWTDLTRPESLRPIEGVRPESWHTPDWSRDSRRLLVVGEGGEGFGLYEVTPASGQIVALELPHKDIVQALYVPQDRRQLLVLAGDENGRLRLRLYDRGATPWRELASLTDVAVARIDATNGRVLFTRPGQPGLWVASLSLAPDSVRVIDPAHPDVARYRAWAVDGRGQPWFLERRPDCVTALRPPHGASAPGHGPDAISRAAGSAASAGAGDTVPVGASGDAICVDRTRRSGAGGFSLGASGEVYLTLSEWDGGDIGFLTLPEAPEAAGPY